MINRVDSVVVATSPATVTRIGYNNLFPLSTTDPKGQVYQTAYNALGWVTSETDPAGGVTSHAYSVDGDLRQTTTRRGQTVTVTYDALHRPLTQTGSHARSFSYANNGFVVTGTSAASTQTSFLNLRGQADSVQTVLQGQTFVQRFGYTAAGLLDTVSVTGPGGMTFQGRKYLYDEAQGLLTGIRLGGALTQFVTDGNANPTGITFPAGDTQQILRGVIQAPIRLTTSAPYVETVERWLGLDKAGRVTAHLNYPDADLGRFFQFDPLGRLIEGKDMQRPPSGGQTGCPEDPNAILCADGSVPSEPTAEYSVVGTPAVYSFDAVGNRLDLGGSYTPGNRITQFNGCSYTTDLDGNVTSRSGGGCGAGASFFWSAEGELDSLHTGTTGVKYLYDAGGRLVVKRVNGVVQAVFLWQGDNLLAELDGTATVKRAEYSYYPGLDNLHAVVINNERLYAHADGLGNVIALTDETQGVRRVYAYDDWGNDAGTGGTLAAPNADRARWKGALWLGPELDLYYMRNRWYEPATGRFLSEDPIGLQGGINPVVFTAADPVNGRDPSGLCPPCDGPYQLPEITVEAPLAPWPFSTPRESGFSSGFGTRGGSFGGFTGLGTGGSVGGGGPARPRNQVEPETAPSCGQETLSFFAALAVDGVTAAGFVGGGGFVVVGTRAVLRGGVGELRSIIIRSGATTVHGVFQPQATIGLGRAARAASAEVQGGGSLIAFGSALITGGASNGIATGAARPTSLLDFLPGPGTYRAGRALFQCLTSR